MKPVILSAGFSAAQLEDLQSTQKVWQIHDLLANQLKELYEINHADQRLSPNFAEQQTQFIKGQLRQTPALAGQWVYLPWSGELIHMLGREEYYQLRTNRNRNLITSAEQTKIANATVAVAGMSVGGGIAVSLAYSGVSKFKLADFDQLETANLNRVRAAVQHVGQPKINVICQQIYEVDPYATIESFEKGINNENLSQFLTGATVAFDENDDFVMKVRLRQSAKQAKVPVIMLTNLGNSVLVDVERYDNEPDCQIFNGLLGELPEEILTTKVGEKEKVKYAMQIVGVDNISTRALHSLFEINKTLVGRPQLYSTIAIDGGLAAYLVRRLVLGTDLPSGRTKLNVDEALNLSRDEDVAERQKILDQLKEKLRD